MTDFRTGVHTIEFQTSKYLKLSDLPEKYSNAISPVESKNKRYKLSLPKVHGVPEYSNPADTQQDIEEAFTEFANMGAGCPKMTRIDYRFDDYSGVYADNLQLMTVLVNLIAHKGGIYDRRVFYTDGNHVITSVRCMPDKKDDKAKYGVEYYDKPKQAKTDEYGNARFELRRLNMEGETVAYVLREWRDMFKTITRKDYLAMLEAHAQSLCAIKQDRETATRFVKRMRCMLIGYEEWHKLCKLNGKHTKDYDKLPALPKWENIKPFIDNLTAQLDKELDQPLTDSITRKQVTNELPF